MAQTAANVLGVELEHVAKKVPALFEREGPFYTKLAKKPAEVISDRDMRSPLELRPGGRFGHFDPDGGDLGRGDASVFDKAVINSAHFKYAVEWTTKAQWATDDNRKAVVNAFKHNLAKAMPEMRRAFDAMLQTAGQGVLATITAVANAGGKDTYTLDTDFGAKLLRFGQFINVYNAALSTNRTSGGEVQIDLYDGPNKQIRVNQVTGSAATDKVVISGVSATPPTSLLGIPYHHSDASTGTWLGFDRSTTPEIRANRVNAGGSSFLLPYARLAVNKMMDRVGEEGRKKLTACMHPAQVQSYEELGQLVMNIDKSAKEEGLNLYFGSGNMQMAGVPLSPYFMWNRKRIDYIDLDLWGRCELHAPGFYDIEGRRLFEVRGASGGVATSNIFYLVASWNALLTNPAAGLYIDNLAVPSGY